MNTEPKDETIMSDLTPEQYDRDRAEAQAMDVVFEPDPRLEALANELHKESGECGELWPYRERARRLLPIFDRLKNGEQS